MKKLLFVFLTFFCVSWVMGQDVNVTFSVDMSEYTEPFTTAYVSGSLNGWAGDANPLSDDDGDGIWTGTIPLAPGTYEYKFTLDNFAVQENFAPGGSCTLTTGEFTNRLIAVEGDTAVCFNWNSCAACGTMVEPADVTFSVDMSEYTEPFTTVFVSGSLNGWAGDANPLSDDDGDGIWTGTITLDPGNYEYKFTLDNFAVQENFSPGGTCTLTTGEFTNRLIAVEGDTTVCFAWNSCTPCGVVIEPAEVTFSVDMNGFNETFMTAYVSGTINGWSGDANPLSDEDGDGIWTGTITLDPGTYEYKFTLDNWTFQENFDPGGTCTLTTGDFTNRVIEVTGDTTFCYVWDGCDPCGDDMMNEKNCGLVLDFETMETTTDFQYFGSDIDGTLNNTIDNPNPSGINTSAKVAEYVKPANSEVWAGAFSNPDPATAVDATMGGEVCIKVHMDHIGNVALKLENSTTGGDNWITTVANTKVNEWEEICFSFDNPSEEGPFTPATGHSYPRLVLFFDFQSNADTSATSYFDDVVVCTPDDGPAMRDVTFSVNMSDYAGSFTQVYLSGTMNGWSGDANPLTDGGSGVWSTTVNIPVGVYEYKFTLDNFTEQEMFNGSEECTKLTINDDGRFVNREVTINNETSSLDTVCYNSCYDCGESVNITFNLGMTVFEAAESGVYIAGGEAFGASNERFRLQDPDGDDIYSLTINRPIGFSSFYTYTNGNCPDYSCKEQIAGQDCANADNFNDRFLSAVMQDTVITTCFQECTADAVCTSLGEVGLITFQVDMSNYAEAFDTVYVSGSLNGWAGTANPMSDEDGDSIWIATIELPAGNYEFKFTLDNWAVQEEFMEGDPCTVTNGGFTNRTLTVDGDAALCFEFNTCTACPTVVNTTDLTLDPNLFSVRPTLVQSHTEVLFGENAGAGRAKTLRVFDVNGRALLQQTIDGMAEKYLLDLSALPQGAYIINIQTDRQMAAKRIIKQ